jgi:hypothetical protein
MAIGLLSGLKQLAFSGLEEAYPGLDEYKMHSTVSRNLFRVSLWGALGSGSAALASFIFSKTLIQEGSWKSYAPHIFKPSLTSCLTFAAVASYIGYKFATQDEYLDGPPVKALNKRVSFFAKGTALVGWIGAAAAWASKFITANALVNSVAKHSFYPLLGLGTAGSVLWIFHNWQNEQRKTPFKERLKGD